MNISGWLFSILGVVLVGIIADLIMPNGKLNSFIHSVFGFIILVVIISPFPKLFKEDFDFSSLVYNSNAMKIDQDYLEVMTTKIVGTMENTIKTNLEKAGFLNVDVEIEYVLKDYSYNIKKVVLNIKNLVINKNMVHINKYTEMVQIVKNIIDVEEENVTFNE